MCTHTHTYVYIYIYKYICKYIYICIYIYIYIYLYTCIYIYMHNDFKNIYRWIVYIHADAYVVDQGERGSQYDDWYICVHTHKYAHIWI